MDQVKVAEAYMQELEESTDIIYDSRKLVRIEQMITKYGRSLLVIMYGQSAFYLADSTFMQFWGPMTILATYTIGISPMLNGRHPEKDGLVAAIRQDKKDPDRLVITIMRNSYSANNDLKDKLDIAYKATRVKFLNISKLVDVGSIYPRYDITVHRSQIETNHELSAQHKKAHFITVKDVCNVLVACRSERELKEPRDFILKMPMHALMKIPQQSRLSSLIGSSFAPKYFKSQENAGQDKAIK